MRRAVVVACVGAFLVIVSACGTFQIPTETCGGTTLNGRGTPPDDGCTTCIQDHCCDLVGHCERDEACTKAVHDTHACVVGAGLQGTKDEPACVAAHLGTADLPTRTYGCMRDHCGDSCGLPVCQVDPSVRLIVNPSCDGCLTSSCCAELNACAGNRACALTIQCIVQSCGSAFGRAVESDVDAGRLPQIDATEAAICNGTLDDGGSPPGQAQCITDCLARYAGYAQGAALDYAHQSGCLGFRIYACAVRANCGADCALDASAF